MAYFLAKTDPEDYPAEQFEKDRTTTWNGVRNPQAVRAIRAMRPGDVVFIYHSGKEAAVRAVAKVISAPREDAENPKSAVVDLEFVARLEHPVTLQEIKKSGQFADWELIRQSRLSTMRAPESFGAFVRQVNPNLKL
jgi:predicted RNA-binding protein with PUA-like domain